MVGVLCYGEAVKDKTKRQEFLDRIDLGEYGKYIEKVIYVRDIKFPLTTNYSNKYAGRTLMATHIPYIALREGIGRMKSKIFVRPAAFSTRQDLFMSTPIDHEGFHALQNYCECSIRHKSRMVLEICNHSPSSRKHHVKYLKLTREIPAYMNQLCCSKSDVLTEDEKDLISKRISWMIFETTNHKKDVGKYLEDILPFFCSTDMEEGFKELMIFHKPV